MRTRHAADDSPLNQERYMSSPEYAELRGVMGNAVTAKASLTLSKRKRSLLYCLQALSLEPGGMRAVAQQLFDMFPERVGTPTMIKERIRPGAKLTDEQVENIRRELKKSYTVVELFLDETGGSERRAARVAENRRAPHDADFYFEECRRVEELAAELVDVCVNPYRLVVGPDQADEGYRQAEISKYIDEHDNEDCRRSEFRVANVRFFHDISGALFEFQKRYTAAAGASFAKTNVAKKVTATLDACLKARRMVLIEGDSDSGKSTSAEAWCRMHKGEARFVRLQGVTNKTVFFRAIARALGLASSYMRTAKEMQARVEDMLQRSGLMLVLDESQYAFAQSERIYSRPEIVDWIYTALCNYGVPVALIASPLFSKRLHQAEKQTIWNSDQFRRRIYRYEILPAIPTRNDIELVVKHHLPDGDAQSQKFLAGYAATCIASRKHPETKAEIKVSFAYTAIADTLADAAQIAEAAGRPRVTLKDIQEAVSTFRVSSELAKRQAFDQPRGKGTRAAQSLQHNGSAAAERPQDGSSEETFAGRRPVAALEETHPANSGRAPAFQHA